MKTMLAGSLIFVALGSAIYGQAKNSFSLSFGSISTQNSTAQPATSLMGQFDILFPDKEENINIYLAIDFSTYIADGPRLSSCSDCRRSDYSGFDMGIKVRFEPQKSKLPVNIFTGISRVITKEEYTADGGFGLFDNFISETGQRSSRNFINHFWDLGVGLKAPILKNLFLTGEVLAGYSLDSNPNDAQGIERYELNVGIGILF